MTKVTIDEKEYEFEELSEEVRNNLVSMQYCDAELQRLQAQMATVQTARMAYARAVSEGLNGAAN